MKIEDYYLAKSAYSNKQNVTAVLKKKLNIDYNTSEIIAAAYDLQAGTYSDAYEIRKRFYKKRSKEITNFIQLNIKNITSVLDIGSGELTMFSLFASTLNIASDIAFFATDISLSRIISGRNRIALLKDAFTNIKISVANSDKLPFHEKSIDVITTDHSLEPNAALLGVILKECFRVARRYCVFIEPLNTLQSIAGSKRMKSLGYILDLEKTITKLGGKIQFRHIMLNNYNKLNKAIILIVSVPQFDQVFELKNKLNYNYTYPGSNYFMEKKKNFIYSKESGFLFPVVDKVPVLIEQSRILFTYNKFIN
jgi:ubiquinone/menaquinone biosynthesis C-methylase UbiE